MIRAYPEQSSIFPGETLTLHVSTDAPQFRVDFYRQGAALTLMQSSAWHAGQFLPDHEWYQDWGVDNHDQSGNQLKGWPGYDFTIPTNWTTGVYIAMCVEGDGQGNPKPTIPPLNTGSPDARESKALFVVKNPRPGSSASILYKVPLFTYHAYNLAGGASLYQRADLGVSLRRPGGGTGGVPWDINNQNEFDKTGSPRQTFAHWDALFISWLEQSSYRVDYCTDLDVHHDDQLDLLSQCALLVSVGHDEYWSDAMRDQVEKWISRGGNMAVFSGNTCWWRVTFLDQFVFTRAANWADKPTPDRPENILFGVSFRNGGGHYNWSGQSPIPLVGYTIQNSGAWPFEQTSLKEGDIVGASDALVGYEGDGAFFRKSDPPPVRPTGTDGTPPGFLILGTGDLSAFGDRQGNAVATMGMYTNSGTVFNSATTDWARVLFQGETRVVQITRNVLNRLGGVSKGLASLSRIANVIACDGFFSSDDNYRHAILGANGREIWEIFFHPNTGIGQSVVTTLDGLVDVGSFFTDDDNYRHVIAATGNGDLWEVFFNPSTGVGQTLLGNFKDIFRVAGFFSSDDGYRHAIFATTNGNVYELFYHPKFGQGLAFLRNYPGLVDLAAFFSPDDNNRHVIVATEDGYLYELYFHPQKGQSQALLSRFDGIVRIGAFYAGADAFFSRRVTVVTKGRGMHEIKFSPRGGIVRARLWNSSNVIDVGGFYSPDDGLSHAILATSDNDEVQELFYRS